MSNFIDFLLVISKLQSPIYRRYPQLDAPILITLLFLLFINNLLGEPIFMNNKI